MEERARGMEWCSPQSQVLQQLAGFPFPGEAERICSIEVGCSLLAPDAKSRGRVLRDSGLLELTLNQYFCQSRQPVVTELTAFPEKTTSSLLVTTRRPES